MCKNYTHLGNCNNYYISTFFQSTLKHLFQSCINLSKQPFHKKPGVRAFNRIRPQRWFKNGIFTVLSFASEPDRMIHRFILNNLRTDCFTSVLWCWLVFLQPNKMRGIVQLYALVMHNAYSMMPNKKE